MSYGYDILIKVNFVEIAGKEWVLARSFVCPNRRVLSLTQGANSHE